MPTEEKLQNAFVLRFPTTGVKNDPSFRFPSDLATKLLKQVDLSDFSSLIQLTTCNRSEIYCSGCPQKFIRLLQEQCLIDQSQASSLVPLKGKEAVEHIMRVPTGLDSQLIGDIEILGQFKSAFRHAKRHQHLGGFFERLGNSAIALAKEIRTKTDLNSGISSISYSVVHILRKNEVGPGASILLVGAGSFAKSIAKNVQQYFPNNRFFITNRTKEKSVVLAELTNATVLDIADLDDHINDHDVIITAVDTDQALLLEVRQKHKLVVDLSHPSFFKLNSCENVNYFSLSDATKAINQSISKRRDSVVNAHIVFEEHCRDFLQWCEFRVFNQQITDWKDTIEGVSQGCPFISKSGINSERAKHKSVRELVKFLKAAPYTPTSEDSTTKFFEQTANDPFVSACKEPIHRKFQCQKCSAQSG